MKKRIAVLGMLICLLLTACHEHTFSPATCTNPETCKECGETQGEALGHKWQEATCEKAKTCSMCGETQGEALGHKWQEATCEKAKICSVCGKEDGKPLGHDYVGGNCTEDAKCSRCGDLRKAPGHIFAEATCLLPKTCNICGEQEGRALGHDLKSGKCTRCDYTLWDLEEIARICTTQATCETDKNSCIVLTETAHNPYDVVWDYGEEYQTYVDACDWSLVFDASYYKKTFPMLAIQYHDDDALLLEHFQTVGIHEGRQGCAGFNVGAYYYNCSDPVYRAFGKNWAAYYIYYMLNYEEEAGINTVSAKNGKEIHRQYKVVLTWTQQQEFSNVNNYRSEVEAQQVIFDAELTSFANFRAYLNAHDGYKAHDWAENDTKRLQTYLDILGSWGSFAENTVTCNHAKKVIDWAEKYRYSEKHYHAMVSEKYNYVGCSNAYYGNNLTSQFDVYVAGLSTAMHQ